MEPSIPTRLYLNSYPMGQKYQDCQEPYFQHLKESWAGQCDLIKASDAFTQSECGRNFNLYLEWVTGRPEGYDEYRFTEFVVPAEAAILARLMDEDDPRRDLPHANGINAVEAESGCIRVGKITGQIVAAALETGRVAKVIGPDFEQTLTVVKAEPESETYMTARGRPRTLTVYKLYWSEA